MKILFAHQNFPGQYRMILDWLVAQGGHEIVFLTQRGDVPAMNGVRVLQYQTHRKAEKDPYFLTRYFEDCMGAGYAVAQVCKTLHEQGFTPDIILGHIGWGELTFTRQIWPDVPVIGYFEYFFLAQGGLEGSDPEFPSNDSAKYVMHARNAINYLNHASCDLGLTPTKWQHDTFPASFHDKFYTCHDGIRTDLLGPDPQATLSLGRLDRPLTRDDEVFTYMARNLEPARGFHIFMRALPKILDARPNARAIVIGGSDVSYGNKSGDPGGYRAMMEAELGDRIDWSRVHFLGRVPYADFQRIIQVSRAHIYLTAPFVLSWSLLESMAMESVIIASGTDPVREAIEDGKTGILFDFFSPDALAARTVEVLEAPEKFAHLGPAARAHVVEHYDFLTRCLPEHIARINALVPAKRRIACP